MSTNADCCFYEKTKGQWFYKLQCWPYGDNDEYDTFGPFPHFKAAAKHLDDHHANPGGYSVSALPGCLHDMVAKSEYFFPDDEADGIHHCDRCGGRFSTLAYDAWLSRVKHWCEKWKIGFDEDFLRPLHGERRTPAEAAGKLMNKR